MDTCTQWHIVEEGSRKCSECGTELTEAEYQDCLARQEEIVNIYYRELGKAVVENIQNEKEEAECGTALVNREADIPPDILQSKWNWGAFLLAPWWQFAHGLGWWVIAWIAASIIVPYAGFGFFVFWVAFPIFANRLAWRRRRFDSPSHFFKVQRIWTTWGIVLLIPYIAGFAVLGYVCFQAWRINNGYAQ